MTEKYVKVISGDSYEMNIDIRLMKRCNIYRILNKEINTGESILPILYNIDEIKEFENFLMEEKIESDDINKITNIIKMANYMEYDGYISKNKLNMFQYIIEKLIKIIPELKNIKFVYKYCDENNIEITEWKTLIYLIENKNKIYEYNKKIKIERKERDKKINNFYNFQNNNIKNLLCYMNNIENAFLFILHILGMEGPVYIDTHIYKHADNWKIEPSEEIKKILKEVDIIEVGYKNKYIDKDDILEMINNINKQEGQYGRTYCYAGIHHKDKISSNKKINEIDGKKYEIYWYN